MDFPLFYYLKICSLINFLVNSDNCKILIEHARNNETAISHVFCVRCIRFSIAFIKTIPKMIPPLWEIS